MRRGERTTPARKGRNSICCFSSAYDGNRIRPILVDSQASPPGNLIGIVGAEGLEPPTSVL